MRAAKKAGGEEREGGQGGGGRGEKENREKRRDTKARSGDGAGDLKMISTVGQSGGSSWREESQK